MAQQSPPEFGRCGHPKIANVTELTYADISNQNWPRLRFVGDAHHCMSTPFPSPSPPTSTAPLPPPQNAPQHPPVSRSAQETAPHAAVFRIVENRAPRRDAGKPPPIAPAPGSADQRGTPRTQQMLRGCRTRFWRECFWNSLSEAAAQVAVETNGKD